jgi:hypothetical protein
MPELKQDKLGRRYVAARAKGLSRPQAAVAVGVGVTTAYRWESNEDVRKSIEALAQVYVSKLPDAIKLGHDLIDAGNNADKTPENAHILKLAAEESRLMRQAVGIAPSHAPSVVINNLVLGNQTNVLLPAISKLLDQHTVDITPDPYELDE